MKQKIKLGSKGSFLFIQNMWMKTCLNNAINWQQLTVKKYERRPFIFGHSVHSTVKKQFCTNISYSLCFIFLVVANFIDAWLIQ